MSTLENSTPRVGIKQVKQMLQDGKTRKEIAEHYGKSQAEMNATVWQHPELKGLKTKKIHYVEIVEDEDAVEVAANSQDIVDGPEEVSTTSNASEETSSWSQPVLGTQE